MIIYVIFTSYQIFLRVIFYFYLHAKAKAKMEIKLYFLFFALSSLFNPSPVKTNPTASINKAITSRTKVVLQYPGASGIISPSQSSPSQSFKGS